MGYTTGSGGGVGISPPSDAHVIAYLRKPPPPAPWETAPMGYPTSRDGRDHSARCGAVIAPQPPSARLAPSSAYLKVWPGGTSSWFR